MYRSLSFIITVWYHASGLIVSRFLLLYKAKRQYLLTCKVSIHCLLALYGSIIVYMARLYIKHIIYYVLFWIIMSHECCLSVHLMIFCLIYVYTWVSDRLSCAASSTRSGVDRYLWASNRFSNPCSCWSLNTVRALRRRQCLPGASCGENKPGRGRPGT